MNNEPIIITQELLDKVSVWRGIMREMRDRDVEKVLLRLVQLEIKQRAEFNQTFQLEVERRETDV